jgi:cytidyltransferase-like protein
MAKKIGLVTGIFDLLHKGHSALLSAALTHSDYLFLGLESDLRAQELKGINRPLFSQDYRKQRLMTVLASLSFAIVNPGKYQIDILPELFSNSDIRHKWLKQHHINLLFVSQHDPHLSAKQNELREINGRVFALTPLRDQLGSVISMTQIVQRKQSSQLLLFSDDQRFIGSAKKTSPPTSITSSSLKSIITTSK